MPSYQSSCARTEGWVTDLKLRIRKKQELILFFIIVAIGLVIGILNPVFFTPANLLGIVCNMTIDGIFAFAVMLGIIIGGIDVSFPAIAVVSMYTTTRMAVAIDYSGPVLLLYLMSGGIGLALGLFNGVLITKFKLPAFIVTLGTSNLYYGLLISLLGGAQVDRLVQPMENFARLSIFQVGTGSSTTAVPLTILFMLLIMAVTAFILHRTMLGRMIYAIGGDRVSAEKTGFPVNKVTIFVYAYIGAAAGLAGLSHTIQTRACYPTDLMGGEMLIIAAIVLGGTTISGGRGTVTGTFLGLFLITMIQSSLILVGIPSIWQTMVVGAMIVIGTSVSAYQVLRDKRRLAPVMEDEPPGGGSK